VLREPRPWKLLSSAFSIGRASRWPAGSRGSADGIQIGYSNDVEQASSEIAAYTVEIQCLENKRKNDKCGKCKTLYNEQIGKAIEQVKYWEMMLPIYKHLN